MQELPDIQLGHLKSEYGQAPLHFFGPDRGSMYVIGRTRSGKSTFLENIAKQDIETGAGVSFLDPHGDSYGNLLDFIPRRRAEDVVIFDPYAERERPVGINLLGWVPPDDRPTYALCVVKMFHHLWANTWGMRLQQILQHSILALLDYQGSTFLSVLKLLIDPDYCEYVLKSCRNPVVRQFFEEEKAKWGAGFMAEAINPVMSRAEQYLISPIVQNIFGQPKSTIDFADIMDSRKIFLANLAEGALEGDLVNLLGAMLVTKHLITAQQRYRVPERARVPHPLIVDEFQRFTTQASADVFTGAGKFKLFLVAAHQALGQIEDEQIRSAVMQSRNAVAFSVTGEDAKALVNVFGEGSLELITEKLNRYEACVKIDANGETQTPLRVVMLPPIPRAPGRKSRRELITRLSRERYAPKTRQAIEQFINETVFQWEAPAKSSRREGMAVPPAAKKEYERPWRAGRSRSKTPAAPPLEAAPVPKNCTLCDRGIVRVRPKEGGTERALICPHDAERLAKIMAKGFVRLTS
jgi:hypothetical protein